MPDQPAASLLTLDVERCSPEVVVILCHGKLISPPATSLLPGLQAPARHQEAHPRSMRRELHG